MGPHLEINEFSLEQNATIESLFSSGTELCCSGTSAALITATILAYYAIVNINGPY
jgi:hypothetical protein